MKSENKYYVVWNGRKAGIFTKWDDCKEQIYGFEGAQYKSFKTLAEAEAAFKNAYKPEYLNQAKQEKIPFSSKPIKDSIAVDAAWSTSTLKMEYQGVYVASGKLLFHSGPYDDATNNIGEFLAIVHALAMCKKSNIDKPIYTDSKTAMAWVKKKKANTKLELTEKNNGLFDLIVRAEKWLTENKWNNQILKWETKIWGEIPADFGRK
jgi:ribonuclease HI